MTPAELAKQVRYIEVTTKKAVTATFAGEYKSAFKGRGMEFDEVREYQLGDDIRTIDWNVTARAGKPYTKRFVEERELTILLLVDFSASGLFGSTERTKLELVTRVSALIAFSAIENSDRVGLAIFTDRIERYVPPRKGSRHVLRLIRELLAFTPEHRGTDIGGALEATANLFRRRSVLFVISDFLDSHYERALRVAAKRHDCIALSVHDLRERELPHVGLVQIEDTETGRQLVIDTAAHSVRAAHARENRARLDKMRLLFAGAGIDHIPLTVGEDYLRPLMRLFVMRERRH
jgi:uncharacterized protein (DUF58 family)